MPDLCYFVSRLKVPVTANAYNNYFLILIARDKTHSFLYSSITKVWFFFCSVVKNKTENINFVLLRFGRLAVRTA